MQASTGSRYKTFQQLKSCLLVAVWLSLHTAPVDSSLSAADAFQWLQVHTRNRPMADDVNLTQVAQDLPGLSGRVCVLWPIWVCECLLGNKTGSYLTTCFSQAWTLNLKVLCRRFWSALLRAEADFTLPFTKGSTCVGQQCCLCCTQIALSEKSEGVCPKPFIPGRHMCICPMAALLGEA